MNIGQLFVAIGVKGAEKAKEGVGAVTDGLKKTASTSWEVKAGLLGAMYALERFTAAGNARGTEIFNLSKILHVDDQDIQRYMWAANQANVSNETVASSLMGLQSAASKLKYSGEDTPWMGYMRGLTGLNLQDMIDNPLRGIDAIQKLINDPRMENGLKNLMLQQLDQAPMAPAYYGNEFDPKVLAKAHVMPTGDINATNENRRNLSNLWNEIELAGGHLNAQFGGKLIDDVGKLVPEVVKLVTAFGKLANKLELMKGIGLVFEGWSEIFHGLSTVVDAFSDPKKMKVLQDNIKQFLTSDIPGMLGATPAEQDIRNVVPNKDGPGYTEPYGLGFKINKNADTINHSFGPKIGDLLDQLDKALPGGKSMGAFLQELMKSGDSDASPTPSVNANGAAAPTPRLPSPAAAASPSLPGHIVNQGGSSQVEFNQTLNFHDKVDAIKAGDEARRQVKTALRSNPALNRVV